MGWVRVIHIMLFFIGVILVLILTMYGHGLLNNFVPNVSVLTPKISLSVSTSPSDRKEREWLHNLLNNTIPSLKIPQENLLIMSAHCAIDTYLHAQWESLQAFVKVPFTFIVLNDAKKVVRPDRYAAIERYCRDHNIIHIPIPQVMHDERTIVFPETVEPNCNLAPCRTAIGVQIMLEVFKQHSGYALVLDSDAAFINDFVPEQVLPRNEPYTYMALDQSRESIDYIWNAFIFFDMTRFPHPEWMNVDCGNVNGVSVDVGGHWNDYYRKTNRTSMPKPAIVGYTPMPEIDTFVSSNPDMCFNHVEFFAGCVLHAHNGGGWDPAFTEEKQIERAKIFHNFISKMIKRSC